MIFCKNSENSKSALEHAKPYTGFVQIMNLCED